MALAFNALLHSYGVDPAQVRLLRHQTNPFQGKTLYGLWRDDHDEFLRYQSIQTPQNRSRLASPFWASFVVTPAKTDMFVGLWRVTPCGSCPPGTTDPLSGRDVTGLDRYEQEFVEATADHVGRVYIDWGSGTRSWAQRADRQDKLILELTRTFQEEAFPGYGRFIANLSAIEALPPGWLSALSAVRGVYLLTCPRTREQYVGSACGEGGLLARWYDYVRNGHGGNVGLKSRDPADYQVSVLEVSSSNATVEEILAAEQLWKAKLQSKEMGLNRN